MYKAQQILAGIAEPDLPSKAGFVVGSRSTYAKSDYTLILIPDINHTVYMRISAYHLIMRQ